LSVRLDGIAILRAVARHPGLFCDVGAAVDKAALAILTAQLKARTFDLARLKRTRKALSAELMAAILKALPATLLKALAARIDPHRPKHTTGRASRTRSHLMALASGAATPAPEEGAARKPTPRSATTTTKGAKESTTSRPGKRKARSAKTPTMKQHLVAKSFWATSVMAKPERLSSSARRPM